MSSPIDGSTVRWRKSSRSSGGGNECVEVANLPGTVAVRDSKNPAGGALAFDRSKWAAFAGRVKAGGFDL
jgi:hypothetical protein